MTATRWIIRDERTVCAVHKREASSHELVLDAQGRPVRDANGRPTGEIRPVCLLCRLDDLPESPADQTRARLVREALRLQSPSAEARNNPRSR